MSVSARGTGERKTSYLLNKENIIVSSRIEQILKKWVNVVGNSPVSSI